MASKDWREFIEILTDLDDGRVHEELTRKIRDVVIGARDAQQPGKLTLTITIKPDGRQFVVLPKVKAEIPTAKAGQTMFFADDKGTLRKDDPKQVPLRNVPARPTEIRSVGSDNPPSPEKGA